VHAEHIYYTILASHFIQAKYRDEMFMQLKHKTHKTDIVYHIGPLLQKIYIK